MVHLLLETVHSIYHLYTKDRNAHEKRIPRKIHTFNSENMAMKV